MTNFIQTYDDVISKEFCDQLIAMFEESPEHHEEIFLEGHRSFTQVTLQQHAAWRPFAIELQNVFDQYISRYMEDCNVTNKMFPQQYSYEMFRMKRYLPNDIDEFSDHVDVGNLDSARRFLVFFLYVAENERGFTDFPQYNIRVVPKVGRMTMFPPLWPWLHAGVKPIDKPKYIIGSYLHYV